MNGEKRDSLSPKMDALYSFEAMVFTYQATRYHNPEQQDLITDRREKLIPYSLFLYNLFTGVLSSSDHLQDGY
jgi:hypothetical protein